MGRMVRILGAALVAVTMVGAPAARASRPAGTNVIVVKVKIVNFAFKPGTLTIAKGTKVKWINKAVSTNHTTTSDTGLWNSGTLAPGQSFAFKFTRTGTFTYHCMIHPIMTGKIKVIP